MYYGVSVYVYVTVMEKGIHGKKISELTQPVTKSRMRTSTRPTPTFLACHRNSVEKVRIKIQRTLCGEVLGRVIVQTALHSWEWGSSKFRTLLYSCQLSP